MHPSSFLSPTFSFSMDLSIEDRVFYTCSSGVRVLAMLVGTIGDLGMLYVQPKLMCTLLARAYL